MRKLLRIVAIVLGVLAVLLALAITATVGWRPIIGPHSRPLTERKFEPTPQRLARGEYLAENLLDCFTCHSERDWSKHDPPLVPGTKG